MKNLSFYQKYQLALLTLVILLFVILITMRIFGYELPDDLQGYMTTIWAIILLLIDAKELQNSFFPKTPGEPTKLGIVTITPKEEDDEKSTTAVAPAADSL